MSSRKPTTTDGIVLGGTAHVKVNPASVAGGSELITLLKKNKPGEQHPYESSSASTPPTSASGSASHHPGFVVGGGSMPTITSPMLIQQERTDRHPSVGSVAGAGQAGGPQSPSPSATPAPLPLTALQRVATWWAVQGSSDDGRLPAWLRLREQQGPQLKVSLDDPLPPPANANAGRFTALARLRPHSTGRPNRLESMIPACYNASPAPAAAAKLGAMTDETLLYIFYGMPGDALQRLAARELQTRHWRWHREMGMWLVREAELAGSGKDLAAQMAAVKLDPKHYIVFDPNTWTRIRRELPAISEADWLDLAPR